jgi:hypothetical protein
MALDAGVAGVHVIEAVLDFSACGLGIAAVFDDALRPFRVGSSQQPCRWRP